MTTIRQHTQLLAGVTALNVEQQEVVNSLLGKVVVTAPVGTGRSLVTTQKIAKIVSETTLYPFQILVLANTSTRTKELQEELTNALGRDAEYVMMMSFFNLLQGLLVRSRRKFIDSRVIDDKEAWEDYRKDYQYIFVDLLGKVKMHHYYLLENIFTTFPDVTVFTEEKLQCRTKGVKKITFTNFYGAF